MSDLSYVKPGRDTGNHHTSGSASGSKTSKTGSTESFDMVEGPSHSGSQTAQSSSHKPRPAGQTGLNNLKTVLKLTGTKGKNETKKPKDAGKKPKDADKKPKDADKNPRGK